MSSFDPHARLRELGLELPTPPAAVAAYVPFTVARLGEGRSIVHVAGQVALRDGAPVRTGSVPEDVGVEDAADIARLCALNVLAQLHAAVGLETIEQLLAVSVFVCCGRDFTAHPTVANGASQLFIDVLGERGRHSRAAVGSSSLPLGVPVEVTAVALAGPA